MPDELSPVEQVIYGWELTRQWLAEEMTKIRRLRAIVRGMRDVNTAKH